MLTYSICFPLSDSLHPVWQSPGPSTSLQMAQFHSFSWLSNSPLLYMYYIFFIHFSVDEHIGCFCSHSLSSWLPKLCHSSFCVPDISGLLVLQSGISSMRWVTVTAFDRDPCYCLVVWLSWWFTRNTHLFQTYFESFFTYIIVQHICPTFMCAFITKSVCKLHLFLIKGHFTRIRWNSPIAVVY